MLLPGLPVAGYYLHGLLMIGEPVKTGRKKSLAFRQRGLAALAVSGPLHIIGGQQQMQVVVTFEQFGFKPRRAVAKQGLAPEDIAE